ncbi:RelB antitoxin [compost metagenome]
MEPSDAIRLFYQQIANRGEFPLELRVPNQTTVNAMNADVEPSVYKSSDDLFNDI